MYSFIGWFDFDKKTFKECSLYISVKIWPTIIAQTSWDHNLKNKTKNLNLHHLRMLLYKFKIFWPDGSREKNISNYFPLLIFVWKLDTSPMWPNSTCELNKFKYNQPEEALTQILVVFKNVSLYMPLQKFKLPFWSNLPQEIILLYKLKYKIPTCKDAHKFKLFFGQWVLRTF